MHRWSTEVRCKRYRRALKSLIQGSQGCFWISGLCKYFYRIIEIYIIFLELLVTFYLVFDLKFLKIFASDSHMYEHAEHLNVHSNQNCQQYHLYTWLICTRFHYESLLQTSYWWITEFSVILSHSLENLK